MTREKVVRFYLFFITSSICSLKGYFCFFLQHSSGRCVRSAVNPFLSKVSVKFWYLEITNQCTDPASQFRFQDDGVLNHVSSTGCIVPLSGKVDPKPGTTLVVFDDQNSCANKTAGQTYTQTVQGSLRHSSGKCIQPHTSFQTVPSIGAKLEYTTTCNATKQQFILGSVTCDGERTKDVNCPSSQVIMVTSANYGGLGRLKTCGYNLNYNCLLPASLCHVKRQCDGQQSCEINVGTSEFKHDPCPGTSKYLHLEYKCVSKTDFIKESIHVTSARLASEVFPGQGYVEVLADSKPEVWQRLCIKNWKDPEQQVICRSLGYSGAKQRSASATTDHGLAGNHHVIHSDMHCSRNEKNVSLCCFEKLAGNEEDTCPMMAYVACSICSEPMLSGKNRADFTFTASNSIPGYTADQAMVSSNRSWCGVRLADYLEIDLGRRHVISQLSTLGDRSSRHRVTSYEFLFSKDKNDWFEGIAGGQKLFTGNLDNSKKLSTTILDSLATARYIKILPKSWSGQPCMRLEICGHKLLPDAPRNITLSRLSAFTASVSWIKPTENGDGKFTDFLVRLFKERKMEYSTTSKAGHVHFSTLKPYTQYTVTVQAGNKHGYGSKVEIIFRTNSSVPSGPPTNIKIVPESATSLGISWKPPLLPHRNGILDGNELCFAHVQSDEDCDRLIRTKSTTLRVSNLEVAMEYKVKISARNDAGFGNYSADYFQITNAEAPSCNLSTITKETFVINLQEPKKEVRFCQVIVMAITSQDSFQKTLLYSDKLFTYLEASGSSTPLPYVAAEFSASDFAEYKEFTVGDGSIFSALPGIPRNNGAVKEYFNGPLSSQTRYTVIQRFHSDKELLYSSDFLPPVKTKGHGSFDELKADSAGRSGRDFKVPFIVVTILLLLVLLIVICFMLLRRQRGMNKNSEQSTPAETTPMNHIENNDNQQTTDSV